MMRDHNTQMVELCKVVDNLKGSVDNVVNLVAELTHFVKEKFLPTLDEIRRRMINLGGNLFPMISLQMQKVRIRKFEAQKCRRSTSN